MGPSIEEKWAHEARLTPGGTRGWPRSVRLRWTFGAIVTGAKSGGPPHGPAARVLDMTAGFVLVQRSVFVAPGLIAVCFAALLRRHVVCAVGSVR